MKFIILCLLLMLTGCRRSKGEEAVKVTPVPIVITNAPEQGAETLIEAVPKDNVNISSDDSINLDASDNISYISTYNEKPERKISYDFNGKSLELGILEERVYTQLEQEILEGGFVKIENEVELYLDTDNIKDVVKLTVDKIEKRLYTYTLTVNNCKINGEIYDNFTGNFYAARLTGTTEWPQIQLLIETGDYMGTYYMIFCYAQINGYAFLQHIGTIYTSRVKSIIVNKETFSCKDSSRFLYPHLTTQEYVICYGEILNGNQDIYNYTYAIGKVPNECSSILGDIFPLARDLNIYQAIDDKTVIGTIKAGSNILLCATDEKQWVYVEDYLTELSGWIFIEDRKVEIDGEYYRPDEVFELLPYFLWD